MTLGTPRLRCTVQTRITSAAQPCPPLLRCEMYRTRMPWRRGGRMSYWWGTAPAPPTQVSSASDARAMMQAACDDNTGWSQTDSSYGCVTHERRFGQHHVLLMWLPMCGAGPLTC